MENPEILIVFAFVIVGLVSTVIYYFSRFYFNAGQEDPHSAVGPIEEAPAAVPEEKSERVKDVAEALASTRQNFLGRITKVFAADHVLSDQDLENLEEVLYTSDLGTRTVQRLVEHVGEKLQVGDKSDLEKVRGALRTEMLEIFSHCEEPLSENGKIPKWMDLTQKSAPQVWMVVGVNGAGKTTTIGKLAHLVSRQEKKVLVAAGDTFRAAAQDQLKVWTERAQVEVFSPEGVKDPSAVAFEGVQKAVSQHFDLVIIDTAGRLHTQDNLMEELKKMRRVMDKAYSGAPHEILLVIDANSGQNAISQAAKFNDALKITGVILTKLDGTAKGGVAVGIADQLQVPIKIVGVGEGLEDLRPFNSKEFVESII